MWRVVVLVAVGTLMTVFGAAAVETKSNPTDEVQVSVGDPRLDQKITYRCEAKRLDEVLPEIARQTGVVIGVDPSKRFWSVRQRKVTLFIKDMPLREFMNQLTTLLDYHFTRQGKPGEYTYTLWQDVRGRNREQAILNEQAEMRDQHRRLAIEETLRDAELALAMSPEEAKAIEESNPWLAYLAGNPRGRAFAELLRAIPSDFYWEQVEGKWPRRLRLELSDLQPRGREALQEIWSLVDLKRVSDYYQQPVQATEVESLSISTRHSAETLADAPFAAPFVLHLGADGVIVDSFSIGRSGIPASDAFTSGVLNEEELRSRTRQSEVLRAAQRKDNRTDPDLELTADYSDKKPATGQSSLAFELQMLAELYDLNIMHEHFPNIDRHSAGGGSRRLAAVLDAIEARRQIEWSKTGKVIRFRHSNWAERRSWEIPADWIAYWLAIIESQLHLDLETLSDITSSLSSVQLEKNFGEYVMQCSSSIDDPALVNVFRVAGIDHAIKSREELEFYASLTPSQKSMLWSPSGLPFEDIIDNPIFGGRGDLRIGEARIYDLRFHMYSRQNSKTMVDETFMSETYSIWLNDLYEWDRESLMSQVSPEALTMADTEPVEIVQGGDSPLFPVDREKVRLSLEEWRKAKEQAAAKKAEQASQ